MTIIHNAYFIGWVVGNAKIHDDKICFFIKQHDKDIVSKLYNILINDYNVDLNAIYYNITKSSDFYLQIRSRTLIRDIINILGLKYKSNNVINNNSNKNTNYYHKKYINSNITNSNITNICSNSCDSTMYYIRGLFESKGFMYKKNNMLFCGLRSFNKTFLYKILYNIQFNLNIIDKNTVCKNWVIYNKKYSNYYFTLFETNAYNFLNYIYNEKVDSCPGNYTLNRKYQMYNNIEKNYIPFYKTHINAWLPIKSHNRHDEFYLTIIKKIKVEGNVHYYDTCIQLKTDHNMSFDIACKNILKYYGYQTTGYIFKSEGNTEDMLSVVLQLIKSNPLRPDILLPCALIKMTSNEKDTNKIPMKILRTLH